MYIWLKQFLTCEQVGGRPYPKRGCSRLQCANTPVIQPAQARLHEVEFGRSFPVCHHQRRDGDEEQDAAKPGAGAFETSIQAQGQVARIVELVPCPSDAGHKFNFMFLFPSSFRKHRR